MSKILNWTFGACFRTLGRFLAIFIVGVLLIFIGSKIGIELPDWLALRVNASTVTGWASELPTLSRLDIRECTNSNCSTNLNMTIDYFESPYELRTFTYNTSSLIIGNNGYLLLAPGSLEKNYLYQIDYYVCSNKTIKSSTYSYDISAINYTDGTTFEHNYKSLTRAGLDTTPIIDGGRTFTECNLFSGIISPKVNTPWVGFRIKSSSNISGMYLYTISFNIKELGIYSSALEDIIENSGFATAESVEQVQESVIKVEEEIKETQDTITNDDTSGAQGSADGFFNDFQSEDFGLSSIVTAPLRGINAMLNDTCIAPSATYKGQTFSLPCGSMLWSRPGGDDFRTFINVMYGGFLAYLVIRKFFLDVETLKNPNSDKVEVDKL